MCDDQGRNFIAQDKKENARTKTETSDCAGAVPGQNI
jgi:hypothetical protein